MDATRWHRSRYPVQVPSTKASQLSPAPLSLKETDYSPMGQLPNGTQATWYSTSWNQPGLEDQAERNVSRSDPTDDIQGYNGSSTAFSASQRSASPTTPSHEFQSRLGGWEGKGNLASVHLPKMAENADFQVSSSWARSTYPQQARTQMFTGNQLPQVASIPKDNHEQISIQESTPAQEGVMHTSLRRTSRNRRIESPITPIEMAMTSAHNQPSHSNQTRNALGASPCNRRIYPLHPAQINSTLELSKPPPLQDQSGLTRQTNVEPTEASSPDTGSVYEQVGALQSSRIGLINLPASPPQSESESENVDKISSHQTHNGVQAAERKKTWQRRRYPLQAPVSNANLRTSPSPPSSPETELENISKPQTDGTREAKSFATESKAIRRQKYPLQSPASIANLQPTLSPAFPTIQISQEKNDTTARRSRELEVATKVVEHWRRQVYPSQSTHNMSPFQRAPTPQPPEIEREKTPDFIHLPKTIRAVTEARKDSHTGRTIVVLLEGTGDKFDNDNTNIVHLITALKKDDPHQVTYYQAGIGTYSASGLSRGFTAAMDMAVGAGLGLHVRDAYHFVMHTYKEGDKICIFGFSRGAYAARCLAGMIHKVGLLPPRNDEQIDFAYEFYKNDTDEGWKQSNAFKKTFCIDVNVYFLGCFDSVASVGFIPRQLPLSSTPVNKARYFRHAMALDERRAKFKICRHQKKTFNKLERKRSTSTWPTFVTRLLQYLLGLFILYLPNFKAQDDAPPASLQPMKYGKKHHPNLTDEEYARISGESVPFETDLLEVWFAGGHCDVGGGAVLNEERHKLAQIPLRWMIRQAFECNTGVMFKTSILAEYGLDVHTLWPKYQRLSEPAHGPLPSFLDKFDKGLPPKSTRRAKLVPIEKNDKDEGFYHLKSHTDEDWTPEQVEDFYDAMSPFHDELEHSYAWWILEFLPVEYKVPRAPGDVAVVTGMNLGRYRGVEDIEPKLHWTVSHRMQHKGYKIRARTAPHTLWRTVV